MNNAGKAISIVAKIFAVFLIVSIIGGIIQGVFGVAHGVFDSKPDSNDKVISDTIDADNISVFDLDVTYTAIDITLGDEFSYTTNNKSIKVKEKINGIYITENGGSHNDKYHLGVVIPRDVKFAQFEISTGAGNVNIEKIDTDVLEFELGAGDVTVNELNVESKADIDTGAGTFNVNSGKITNLDFDMGAGNANFNAEFIGNNDIECGVGKLNINAKNDITVRVDKGIGMLTINGTPYSDGTVMGNSSDRIQISGGVGDISVNTVDNM